MGSETMRSMEGGGEGCVECAQKTCKSWIDHVKRSGGVKYFEDYRLCSGHGWAAPPGNIFQVRGEDYLSQSKVKVSAAEEWVLEPVAFDWARSGAGCAKIADVMGRGNSRVREAVAAETRRRERERRRQRPDLTHVSGPGPFIWVINLQVPSRENHSLVMYYAAREGGDPSPAARLAALFVDGDAAFRNARLKLIANVVAGPWIVKKAVGERAVALLGRAVSCEFVRGENYMEMDVDIGSSRIAQTIVQLAFGYVTSLTVDLGFVLEGVSATELPERVLAAIRFANLDPNTACIIDPHAPLLFAPSPPAPAPPSRVRKALSRPKTTPDRNKSHNQGFWRSFSTLFHSPRAQCEQPHANGFAEDNAESHHEMGNHH